MKYAWCTPEKDSGSNLIIYMKSNIKYSKPRPQKFLIYIFNYRIEEFSKNFNLNDRTKNEILNSKEKLKSAETKLHTSLFRKARNLRSFKQIKLCFENGISDFNKWETTN